MSDPIKRSNPGNQGSRHPNALLKEEDVIDILKMLKNGYRGKTIALLYGVKPSNISVIKSGQSWRHISRDDYAITVAPFTPKKPLKGYKCKLNDAKVIEILDLLADGHKQDYIAALYGIACSTVSNINCGSIWRHIPRKDGIRKKTNARLTEEIVKEIRQRLSIGEKQSYLAELYGIATSTISSIHVGDTWKHAY